MATASASAAPMIIVDRISPAASGFRPSACMAPFTARPIPIPGPSAPNPMAMAPPMYRTASGSVILPNTLILLRQTTHSAANAFVPEPTHIDPLLLSESGECRSDIRTNASDAVRVVSLRPLRDTCRVTGHPQPPRHVPRASRLHDRARQ